MVEEREILDFMERERFCYFITVNDGRPALRIVISFIPGPDEICTVIFRDSSKVRDGLANPEAAFCPVPGEPDELSQLPPGSQFRRYQFHPPGVLYSFRRRGGHCVQEEAVK